MIISAIIISSFHQWALSHVWQINKIIKDFPLKCKCNETLRWGDSPVVRTPPPRCPKHSCLEPSPRSRSSATTQHKQETVRDKNAQVISFLLHISSQTTGCFFQQDGSLSPRVFHSSLLKSNSGWISPLSFFFRKGKIFIFNGRSCSNRGRDESYNP